jgi:hypothetical protein
VLNTALQALFFNGVLFSKDAMGAPDRK